MNLIKLLLAFFVLNTSVFAATVDLSKSKFTWTAGKITGSFHTGPIKMKSATIDGDAKSLTGGTFVADMSSIDVTDLEGEWKAKFLKHIKSDDFFTIKKFPTATLKIDKLNDGYLFGSLTIKGKTNPISMPVTTNGNVLKGELGFDRTKFDMKYGSGNFFKDLGDKVINDTVKLTVEVVLK